MNEVYENIFDEFNNGTLNANDAREKILQTFNQYSTDRSAFDAHALRMQDVIDMIWGKAIAALYQYTVLSRDLVAFCHTNMESFLESKKTKYIAYATYQIHIKATMVFDEVLTLLANGLPDGAYSHHRSLIELWAVAEVLADSDEEASKEFLSSVSKKIETSAHAHYRWAEKTGKFDTVEGEGGEKNPVTLYSILTAAHKIYTKKAEEAGEDATSRNKFDQMYAQASQFVHPSPNSILARLGRPHSIGDKILGAAAPFGLEHAMVSTVQWFCNTSCVSLNLLPSDRAELGISTLRNCIDNIVMPAIDISKDNAGRTKFEDGVYVIPSDLYRD